MELTDIEKKYGLYLFKQIAEDFFIIKNQLTFSDLETKNLLRFCKNIDTLSTVLNTERIETHGIDIEKDDVFMQSNVKKTDIKLPKKIMLLGNSEYEKYQFAKFNKFLNLLRIALTKYPDCYDEIFMIAVDRWHLG